MGKLLEGISPEEAAFINKQPVYFIATAPSNTTHHVNVSPRAAGSSIQVIDDHTVAICDLSGSGSETAAHVLQNGRITIMLVNLEQGPPKILRLYGHAQLLLPSECEQSLLDGFPSNLTSSAGFRAVYYVHVHRVTASCGFSMPIMTFESHRTILDEYTDVKGKEGMVKYAILKNAFSIDNMPSIAHLVNKDTLIEATSEEGYFFGHHDGEIDDEDDDGDGNDATKNKASTKGNATFSNATKVNKFTDLLNKSKARSKAMGRVYSYDNSATASATTTAVFSVSNILSNFRFSSSNFAVFFCGVLACQLAHTLVKAKN
jgi:hypothetical protein